MPINKLLRATINNPIQTPPPFCVTVTHAHRHMHTPPPQQPTKQQHFPEPHQTLHFPARKLFLLKEINHKTNQACHLLQFRGVNVAQKPILITVILWLVHITHAIIFVCYQGNISMTVIGGMDVC